MVLLESVCASHGAHPALVDVRFAVEPGTLTVVLGPNGSGKSTLLRVVAGLGPTVTGRVCVAGDEVSALSRRELAKRVAFVPQTSDVPVGFTVREVVAMGRAPHQGAWLQAGPDDAQVIEETLGSCELERIADRPIEALSGGERQRVHIARALAQAAPVLLLDEAAAHLDIRHARACHELVRRLVRERRLACLAAMHDLAAAGRYADRVVLLSEGKLLAEGPTDEVMSASLLEQAFGVAVTISDAGDGRRTFSAS